MVLEAILQKRINREMRLYLIFGITIGAVLGFATGIFLAPKSGRELRRDINKRVRDFKDRNMIEVEIIKDGLGN